MKPNTMIKLLATKSYKHKGKRVKKVFYYSVVWTDANGKVECALNPLN